MYKSDNNKAVSVEAEQKKQPRSSTPPKKQITERERERERLHKSETRDCQMQILKPTTTKRFIITKRGKQQIELHSRRSPHILLLLQLHLHFTKSKLGDQAAACSLHRPCRSSG